MILDQAALIPPALNGVNAIFQVAVIRAGVKWPGVKLGPAELRPIRYVIFLSPVLVSYQNH